MTYRETFLKIQRKLRTHRQVSRLKNGNTLVTPTAADATHLEIDVLPAYLAEIIEPYGYTLTPTVSGIWWVIPGQPGGMLRHVLAICYDQTDSWRSMSHFLAHLSLVTLLPSAYSRVFVTEEMKPVIPLMRELFHEQHPVWQYIQF